MKLPVSKLEFDLGRVVDAEPLVGLDSGAVGLRLTFDDTSQLDVVEPLDVAMLAAGFCARLAAVRSAITTSARLVR